MHLLYAMSRQQMTLMGDVAALHTLLLSLRVLISSWSMWLRHYCMQSNRNRLVHQVHMSKPVDSCDVMLMCMLKWYSWRLSSAWTHRDRVWCGLAYTGFLWACIHRSLVDLHTQTSCGLPYTGYCGLAYTGIHRLHLWLVFQQTDTTPHDKHDKQ